MALLFCVAFVALSVSCNAQELEPAPVPDEPRNPAPVPDEPRNPAPVPDEPAPGPDEPAPGPGDNGNSESGNGNSGSGKGNSGSGNGNSGGPQDPAAKIRAGIEMHNANLDSCTTLYAGNEQAYFDCAWKPFVEMSFDDDSQLSPPFTDALTGNEQIGAFFRLFTKQIYAVFGHFIAPFNEFTVEHIGGGSYAVSGTFHVLVGRYLDYEIGVESFLAIMSTHGQKMIMEKLWWNDRRNLVICQAAGCVPPPPPPPPPSPPSNGKPTM